MFNSFGTNFLRSAAGSDWIEEGQFSKLVATFSLCCRKVTRHWGDLEKVSILTRELRFERRVATVKEYIVIITLLLEPEITSYY